MTMPGFAAEVSMYATRRSYYVHPTDSGATNATMTVLPQVRTVGGIPCQFTLRGCPFFGDETLYGTSGGGGGSGGGGSSSHDLCVMGCELERDSLCPPGSPDSGDCRSAQHHYKMCTSACDAQ